jgi:hypothetical protein
VGDSSAEVVVFAHAVFPGKSKPSEHRRKLVFSLVQDEGEWKFDSMTSQSLP